MYIEIEISLNETGDVKLILDTDKAPCAISLSLITKEGEMTIDSIELHKLGQFVVNARRLLTMAHEDSMLANGEDDEHECEEEDEE